MPTRLPNWQSSLSDYLTVCASTPFKYGSLDCGLFVAGAIQAMIGLDVAAPLRGQYSKRAEAFRAIKALCGHATMEAVAEHLAAEHSIHEVPVAYAQRGDAVLMRKGRSSSLGLVAMHGTEILSPGKDGLLRIPLDQATRAWHI